MTQDINFYSEDTQIQNADISMPASKLRNFLRVNYINEETIDLFSLHEIDGIAFVQLKESDMIEMQIKIIGIRKRLLYLIQQWIHSESKLAGNSSTSLNPISSNTKCISENNVSNNVRQKSPIEDCQMLLNCNKDVGKLIVSFLYVFLVFGITAFVMVIAHERLPDMTKYPPLPDLILDNLPYISWAFQASEMVAVTLLILWGCILVMHKYRFILLRRFFNLLGTVFLLRSVTMLITSLSVPGTHLHSTCRLISANQTLEEKVSRALEIWLGFGLSINGVRTCGDYMFSGHTTCLTLLNFFISEYTPRTFYPLHTFAWILNLFGVFFILAAHEHYSIDVFVAFYLSSRLFLYYHWQANNYSLMTRDQQRARIWFPLFTWFESNCPGTIPHDYEVPFGFVFRGLKKKMR